MLDPVDRGQKMATQSLSFVVLSTDLDNFNEIRAALATDSRTKLLSGGNDPEQVHDEVAHLKPSAAIINLGSNGDQAIKLIQRLNTELPNTAIISVAKETSADLILQSLRAGAREFLRLPISSDELGTVLDRIGEFCAGHAPAPKKLGRMTAVFSSKGGCGTSFIAANIAACTPMRTLLIDLNLECGDLPLFLGLDPRHSVADVVSHRNLDSEVISAYVAPYSPNLHLLAAPKEVDPVERIKPEQIFDMLQRLRECYDHVVLDPQHTFDAVTLAALDQADRIVLVLSLDIPAIRSAKRAIQFFDRVGYRRKISVLVNRWSKQIDLDLHQVEEVLGQPVIGSLLSDYQTVVGSINLGKPLVESNSSSKIAREIIRVTQALTAGMAAQEEPKPKKPWSIFSKLTSGKSDTIRT
jgi:pilus assembly protein CpaE